VAASGTPPAPAASVPPGVQSGTDAVTLLQQTPWVLRHGIFHLRLQVSASDPNEQLRVTVYSHLVTRTDFDAALSGQFNGYPVYPLTLSLDSLPVDSSGGIDVDIPVNQAATSSEFPVFSATSGSEVFPVQIGLSRSDGTPQGQPITTYLVYTVPYSAAPYPKLSVSLTVPVHEPPQVNAKGQLGALPTDQSRALAGLVTVIGNFLDIPLSLAVTPQTLDALAAGSALDHSTLAALAQLIHAGHAQVLPAMYVSAPWRGWDSGLAGELQEQLTTGSSELAGVFGTAPSPTSWVVDGGVDASTLGTLVARGAKQLILPDSELSALPATARVNTFASPTPLVDAGGKTVVYGADPGLTADFSNPGGSVLAANQLLAELAMIQLEQPGHQRGVAVLPPPGWSADPIFVGTLLAGLDGHPLLSAVTPSGLFATVPVASVTRTLAPLQPSTSPATGSLSSPPTQATGSTTTATTIAPRYSATESSVLGANDVAEIQTDRQGLKDLQSILPQDNQLVAQLGRLLLTVESDDLAELPRQVLFSTVEAGTSQTGKLVSLPSKSSITLTSTRALIPLTILSTPRFHVRVELRLSSQRLIFHVFTPPEGKCRVPTLSTEVCDLTLTTQNTTLKVPVETRSSGVFPLDVSLWAPGGTQPLTGERDTVRSTAVSGVGVILIVVAIVSLALWWIRDLRHGRRARQLVPTTEDGLEDPGAADPPHGPGGQAGQEVPGDADVVVREFFSTPPPEFQDPPSRPHP
jgi:hypothetical protein